MNTNPETMTLREYAMFWWIEREDAWWIESESDFPPPDSPEFMSMYEEWIDYAFGPEK